MRYFTGLLGPLHSAGPIRAAESMHSAGPMHSAESMHSAGPMHAAESPHTTEVMHTTARERAAVKARSDWSEANVTQLMKVVEVVKVMEMVDKDQTHAAPNE
jgi:hypothetical protein